MRLPGLAHQCELRLWAATELAEAAGLDWHTAHTAIAGRDVKLRTVRRITDALNETPVTEGLHALLTEKGSTGLAGPREPREVRDETALRSG
jgi:hypothetical protein